jgi:MarC family membrane protein
MDITFASSVVILLLVTDPVGNIPIFLSALRRVAPERRRRMIARECLIAYAVLVLFAFFGEGLLGLLGISTRSLNIAGGVILFLIAIRLVFPTGEPLYGAPGDDEPFIVPLAIPAIAGPGAIATVTLLSTRAPDRNIEWIFAITIAIGVSLVTLSAAERLSVWLGDRGILAMERLMGLLLATVSVEMLLRGIEDFAQRT